MRRRRFHRVGHGDAPRLKGNFRALQSLRIPGAVQPFMAPLQDIGVSVGGEGGRLFTGGLHFLRRDQLRKVTAKQFAPVDFKRPAERLVGEGDGCIGQKTADKVRTRLDEIFIDESIGSKKSVFLHSETSASSSV